MLGGAPQRQPLQPGIAGIFKGSETDSGGNFDFVRGGGREESLAIENADPILRLTASQITMNIDAGRAKTARGIRVQHGVNRALSELNVGVSGSDFHREW